jgi:hypothetical protein
MTKLYSYICPLVGKGCITEIDKETGRITLSCAFFDTDTYNNEGINDVRSGKVDKTEFCLIRQNFIETPHRYE